MAKLVLIRHGQSEWNLSNQFTGWVDVDLSEKVCPLGKLYPLTSINRKEGRRRVTLYLMKITKQ